MTPTSPFLEKLTWPEVAGALEAGYTTVVVGVGAVEQHGPHLPLLVDAARADALALAVAERLDRALVAPSIRVGCSEHHMAFPGTVSLRRATLEAICVDYVVSLSRHGFRRVCLVPSHGGNFTPLAEMLDDLRRAVAPDCDVVAYTDLTGFIEVWRGAVAEAGGDPGQVGGHADLAESSEMLVLHPELVRKERAEPGYTDPVDGALLERMFRDGMRSVTPNGILGDPRGMSREIGERCLEAAAEAVVTALEG